MTMIATLPPQSINQSTLPSLWFDTEPLISGLPSLSDDTDPLSPSLCFSVEVDCARLEDELDLDFELSEIQAEFGRAAEHFAPARISSPSLSAAAAAAVALIPPLVTSSSPSSAAPPIYSLDYLFFDDDHNSGVMSNGCDDVICDEEGDQLKLDMSPITVVDSDEDMPKPSRQNKRKRSSGPARASKSDLNVKISKEDLVYAISNLLPADKLSGVVDILCPDKTKIKPYELDFGNLESLDISTLQRLSDYVQSFVSVAGLSTLSPKRGAYKSHTRVKRPIDGKRRKTISSERLRAIFQSEEVLTLTHQDDGEDIDVVA